MARGGSVKARLDLRILVLVDIRATPPLERPRFGPSTLVEPIDGDDLDASDTDLGGTGLATTVWTVDTCGDLEGPGVDG